MHSCSLQDKCYLADYRKLLNVLTQFVPTLAKPFKSVRRNTRLENAAFGLLHKAPRFGMLNNLALYLFTVYSFVLMYFWHKEKPAMVAFIEPFWNPKTWR